MAVFRCKMCGGDLNVTEGISVIECEYCGSKQTVPSADNEKKVTLFGRANRLLLACEFDKAFGVFESIVSEFPEEAEAYWGLILCKYGIEYVDDPATGKKIPTCHRSSFDGVMEDGDFEQVMENADVVARTVYREEAKKIEELRKGIIEVSAKEAPYDIFICYKETAADGDRTVDSVIAQDVYAALTEKGYRVFFSRISLEDKLGVAYEPYIFAALNSAKIMLAFGTDYEYYNAVWVKNEWSRFLQLIAKGEKKTLIPCYKGIDAYDMPKEFAKLQAQDMGKVGAIQDLLRGIEKILPKASATQTVVQQTVIQQTTNATVEPLLKRAFMFLEDGNWTSANEYCEKVLDIDPENAEAYLGKLLIKLQLFKKEDLLTLKEPFDDLPLYEKILSFCSEDLKTVLEGYNATIRTNIKEQIWQEAHQHFNARAFKDLKIALELFQQIPEYKDSVDYIQKCKDLIPQLTEKTKEELRPFIERAQAAKKLFCAWKADPLDFRNINYCTAAVNKAGKLTLCQRFPKSVTSYNGVKSVFPGGIILDFNGLYHSISSKFEGLGKFENSTKAENIIDWIHCPPRKASPYNGYFGIRTDGTVIHTNPAIKDCEDWKDIVQIIVGTYGYVSSSDCEKLSIIGLRKDGTLCYQVDGEYGYYNELSEWKDIVQIVGDAKDAVYGLCQDGTVKVCLCGNPDFHQKHYSRTLELENVVDIACEGWGNLYALCKDGHLAHIDGKDIFHNYTLGQFAHTLENNPIHLKRNGSSIIALNAYNGSDVMALFENGLVLKTGYYRDDPEVEWKLFNHIDTLSKELENEAKKRKEHAEKLAAEKKQKELQQSRRAQGVCQHCGGQFKGLFSKTCVACGKKRDY